METLNIIIHVAVQKASSGQKNIIGNLKYSIENRVRGLFALCEIWSAEFCVTVGFFLHNICLSLCLHRSLWLKELC